MLPFNKSIDTYMQYMSIRFGTTVLDDFYRALFPPANECKVEDIISHQCSIIFITTGLLLAVVV